jgi:hypothetical protein
MKHKGLIIATIAFFLIVNTTYFWEGKLGLFAMPAFLILVLVYFILGIALLRQLFFAFKEKFADKFRLMTLGILAAVLGLTFFFPFGIINFDRISGDDLLVAQREGAANCMTTLKLKDNKTFIEKNVCFGVTEIKGNYKIVHDTIYFENIVLGRYEDTFYKFAIIRPSKFNKDNKHFDLVRFKDFSDTTGHVLWIVKKDLNKPTDKSRTANSALANMAGDE